MKSNVCALHIQQVIVKKEAIANKQASEIASLKEKLKELKKSDKITRTETLLQKEG